jgi:hypothetical protein
VSNKHCDVIKIYITPLLFYNDTKILLENKRQMPIYFGFPKQRNIILYIENPPGYKVESLPESVKVSGRRIALFQLIFCLLDKIQIAVTKEISKAIVSDYYDVLKTSFSRCLISKMKK